MLRRDFLKAVAVTPFAPLPRPNAVWARGAYELVPTSYVTARLFDAEQRVCVRGDLLRGGQLYWLAYTFNPRPHPHATP